MSNVPPLTIAATGVTVPQAVDVRAGVLADDNAAFGGDLDIVTPSTPQAYQADNLTTDIMTANAAVAYTLAMVDPATSEGRFQDGIGRIYFLDRKGATASVVLAQCTGQPGVVMPAGQLAQDSAGLTWVSTGEAAFSGSGLASVQFACTTLGPVQLGISELTRIAQTYPGWDAVTNLGAATLGTDTESRTAFEERRRESVARGGRGSPAAIRAVVWDVDGVLDVFAYDNFTNAVINYGATDYPLAPHSIYVAAVGGDDADVAAAIWSKKDAGCDMNGNTVVEIEDTENVGYPYPVYNIRFMRPPALAIKFAVQLANNAQLPGDIVTRVQAAIIATFNGVSGGQRARIGANIYASNFYGPVASLGTSVSILSIKIGTASATLDTVLVGIDQAPTVQASDIVVTLV